MSDNLTYLKYLSFSKRYIDWLSDRNGPDIFETYRKEDSNTEYGLSFYEWLNNNPSDVEFEFRKHFNEKTFKQFLQEAKMSLKEEMDNVIDAIDSFKEF